jgi:hypothetical protein
MQGCSRSWHGAGAAPGRLIARCGLWRVRNRNPIRRPINEEQRRLCEAQKREIDARKFGNHMRLRTRRASARLGTAAATNRSGRTTILIGLDVLLKELARERGE